MDSVVLDTDVASRTLRGDLPLKVTQTLAGKRTLLTFVTVAELVRGALRASWGLHGYEDCVKVVQGVGGLTRFGSEREAQAWLGDWDPESFDLASAKKVFDR